MTEATTNVSTVEPKTFDLLPLTGAALFKAVEKLGKERTKIEARLNEIEAILPGLKAAADAEYAEQQAREAAETIGLPVGTTVDAEYGRKDKRRVLRGTVIAFQAKTENTPAVYAVQVGEGVNTEVIKVAAVSVKVAQ